MLLNNCIKRPTTHKLCTQDSLEQGSPKELWLKALKLKDPIKKKSENYQKLIKN